MPRACTKPNAYEQLDVEPNAQTWKLREAIIDMGGPEHYELVHVLMNPKARRIYDTLLNYERNDLKKLMVQYGFNGHQFNRVTVEDLRRMIAVYIARGRPRILSGGAPGIPLASVGKGISLINKDNIGIAIAMQAISDMGAPVGKKMASNAAKRVAEKVAKASKAAKAMNAANIASRAHFLKGISGKKLVTVAAKKAKVACNATCAAAEAYRKAKELQTP